MNRLIRNGRNKTLVRSLTILTAVFVLMAMILQPAVAATTQLPISTYAADGVTVLDQTTIDKANGNSDASVTQTLTGPAIPNIESNSENSEADEDQVQVAPSLSADTSDNTIGQSVYQSMEAQNQENSPTNIGLMGIMSGSLTPPDIMADTSQNLVNQAIELTFDDDSAWRLAINSISLDAVDLTSEQYAIAESKITLAQELFAETKDYSIAVKADGYTDAVVTQAIQKPLITVTGDGVITTIEFTENELKAKEQVRARYSTINTWPTKSWYVAEGVKLTDLLALAGVKDDARSIVVRSKDGFTARFTRDEMLTDTRYYYPGLTENHEYFGYILGSPEGAVEVPTLIALLDSDTDNFDYLSDRDSPKLVFGQRWLGEQTNSVFAKYAQTIEVLTADPGKWENPAASKPSGIVAAGTMVELSTSDMDGDGIHYTTDGTDPTYESPMYNWVKKRWWSSRSEELATINHPIAVDRTMTLKAASIGFGKNNSDIVTFNYRVTDAYPPTLAQDTSNVIINQEIEITFPDDQQWVDAITAIKIDGTELPDYKYTLTSNKITFAAGVFTAAKDYTITISATDFRDASLVQKIVAENATSPVLTSDTSNNAIHQAIELTFVENADWQAAVTQVSVDGVALADGEYTVESGRITIAANVLNKAKDYNIVVQAIGYNDVAVIQTMKKIPPVLSSDTTDFVASQPIILTFTEDTDWQDAVAKVLAGDTELTTDQYKVGAGTITIVAGILNEVRDYTVTVQATGYVDTSVTQTIWPDGTAPPALNPDTTNNAFDQEIVLTFDDDENWRTAITKVMAGATELTTTEQYTLGVGTITIPGNVLAVGEYTIVIYATGYKNAVVAQPVVDYPPVLSPQTVNNGVNNKVMITYPSNNSYKNAIRAVLVDGTPLPSDKYSSIINGKITIYADVLNEVKDYNIVVQAQGYLDASVTQPIKIATPTLTKDSTNASVGQPIEITFTDDPTWRAAVTGVTVDGVLLEAGKYTWEAGKLTFIPGVFTEYRASYSNPYKIVVTATGYADSGVEQSMNKGTVKLIADTTNNVTGQPVEITFTDDPYWRSVLTNVQVDGQDVDADKYSVSVGKTIIAADIFTEAKNYTIRVMAEGYNAASVTQTMVEATAEAPVAAFTADQISGTAPLTVQFTDQSTNEPTEWEWDFNNDGTVDSTDQNPTYTYNTAGTYSVKLTVSNTAGSDELIENDYITVSDLVVAVTGVSITEGDQTLEKGTTVQLTAVVEPENATNKNKTWSSDDETVATVSATGLVTGVAEGTATITVTTQDGNKTDSITVTVVEGSGGPTMHVLFDGAVNLAADETFTVTAYNSSTQYTVKENTPLGALHKAANAGGFTYDVTDKNHENSGALLLDNVGDYGYVKGGSEWYAYVNDVLKDGYNNAAGALNLIELVDGDKVEFYYADGIEEETDLDAVKAAATAAVLTVVDSDATTPSDWTLQLSGARDVNVTKAEFEEGLTCGHQVTWTDGDDNIWEGIPLWLLVAMVDDDPDVGDEHINFNDDLAAQSYEIKVIAGDGWSTTLDSAAIARSDAYIIANTLNGEPLPLKTESGKDCWPLYLKGSAISGGQQVGNIVRIELSGLPEPPAGWTLEMVGEVGDTITQEEFEDGLACTGSGHYQEWTDNEGKVWSGVPLWVLLGVVDDIENSSHWTFDDTLAADYTVKVIAGDGFSKTFDGVDVVNSNDYIIANKYDGQPLTGSSAPLRLVGDGVAKADGSLGGSAVGNIAQIEIPELQTPAAADGSWNLALNGKISDVISQAEFEAGVACPNSGHLVEWTDSDGNDWSGIPLWLLAGWVDDRQPHSYDYNQAVAGYKVLAKAGDGYSVDFESADINKSNDYIIANKCNGAALTDSWPLRLVGNGVAKDDGSLSGKSVGNIVGIELTSFATGGGGGTIPELSIIKYAEDGTTILAEETLDYRDMQEQFEVIGDGTTVYKYQGVTFNPDDPWDEDGSQLDDFKIANAVMGTRIKDLCELVGDMGAGTDIVFVASDGWETKLPYSSIYTDPSVQERQGDAILAWYADGDYVPDYKDGMRLFFTPEDTVYSQMDMHETLPEAYWHYYGADGIMYPSCAGLSAKYITTIKIYSVPQGDWTLELDGLDIGGLKKDISKTYFESALTCTMGANHKATYTDSKNRTWEGMPLWLLVGFVDDADQHSDNAFNRDLALSGYQVVITARDGAEVIIDSRDIDRNHDYIVANSLDGNTIPESDKNWPLRLVGPNASGSTSISQIVSIKLVPSASGDPAYTVSPVADADYTVGTTPDGISTMTVNSGISGFKYFTAQIGPQVEHSGQETVVFTHLRNGSQLQINSTKADFDVVDTAQAGFNVQAGDVVKVFIVDELTNATDHNPVILQ